MTNILLWGALPSLPPNEPFELTFKRSGENTGNLLIGNGVCSILKGYQYIFRDQVTSPEHAQEVCSRIVIPASNFLWKSFDLGFMADFIEKTDLPVTMMGLGAQASNRSQVSTIHPNTLRLVKLISERSPSIGVRGFYTAEVLASYGIMNVEVLGCPSLYTAAQQPSLIRSWSPKLEHRISINFSRNVAAHSFDAKALAKIENKILRIAMTYDSQFVIQDELDEASIMDGTASAEQVRRVTGYFNESDPDAVLSYFSINSKHFIDYPSWSESLARCSLSLGSRLHGNIVALLSGVPAVCIVHDSRTLEMCALAGIPFINILQHPDISVDEILEFATSLDFGRFISNMRFLYSKMAKFLSDHGLNHSLPA